jgi:hypothetical protein
LNLSYDQCSAALKTLRKFTNNLADKNANNVSRLWQGSNAGFYHYDAKANRLDLRSLARG